MTNLESDTLPTARRPSPARLRGLAVLAVLVPVVVTVTLAHHTLSDLDIWLHDRAGEAILAGDGIPRTNGYSFTAPDQPWIDHEWLFQILVTVTGNLGATDPADVLQRARGWNPLRIGLATLLVLVLLLGDRAWPHGRGRGSPVPRLAFLSLPAVVALMLIWPRLTIRPELLSYLFFVLALRWIETALDERATATQRRTAATVSRSSSRPPLALVDPRHPAGRAFWITVLWAQCHGFYGLVAPIWLLACVLLPLQKRLFADPGIDPASVRGEPAGAHTKVLAPRWRLAAIGLAILAGLLTPNGLPGLLFPVKAISHLGAAGVDLRTTIAELVPLLQTPEALGTTIRIYMLSLVWAAVWVVATWGRVGLLRIAILILAAWGAWQTQRNIAFYGLAFFLVHSGYRAERRLAWERLGRLRKFTTGERNRRRLACAQRLLGWTLLGASAIAAAFWLSALRSDRFYLGEGVARRYGGGVTPAQYPFVAAQRLRSRTGARPLRVANNVDSAAFLVRQRAGLVYIDGRTEVYPAAIWLEYEALKGGGGAALEILQRRRVDAVCLAHRTQAVHALIQTLFHSPAWRLDTADEAGVLFVPVPPEQQRSEPDDPPDRENLARAVAALTDALPATAAGSVGDGDRCLSLAALARLAGLESHTEALLRTGLQFAPDHPSLQHNLGNVLLARSQFQAALPHFENAARHNRRASGPVVNAGICLLRLGRHDEAAATFARAVKLAPRRAEAWVNLAETRRLLGDRAGALLAYERACALLPDDSRLQGRAAAYRSDR